ncbi:methyltransferase domain-containing protein [Streptomyces sp. A7024]|uniref:Methyltransferase domain-containing protein n=1 Tax=Streptomyces coryli TaxID=1128680 RepID=A0A6G4U7U4_9ACTN|nr:class I SAM-dependent methyltransferase [Streptomyces coryli]NGN68072.1 methyltransferase domain-containing protein [Streptomyces coryli]
MGSNDEYIYDTGDDLGAIQVDLLAKLLDDPTVRCLEATGVQAGWHCLDLGAGGGSITRWLADRVGPGGRVVAVDLDTSHLPERPEVEVRRHDVNDGLPDDGPYDLIHARLLMKHLARREEILKELVGALAPGGWLVTGDFSGRERTVLAAPSSADRQLWDRIMYLTHEVMAPALGISVHWARAAYGHMTAAGLTEGHAVAHSQTMDGGSAGCLLFRNYLNQLTPRLLQEGVTEADLHRFGELMADPGFTAWFYEYVVTRARKPGAPVG